MPGIVERQLPTSSAIRFDSFASLDKRSTCWWSHCEPRNIAVHTGEMLTVEESERVLRVARLLSKA